MKLSDFNYHLPRELIAQFPLPRRDQSRLLIIERRTGHIRHGRFRQITDFFSPGDALVLNNAKVRPVRLIGSIGERTIDVLLVERVKKNSYWAKAKPGSKVKPGAEINFNGNALTACCVQVGSGRNGGMKLLEFGTSEELECVLDRVGLMPLPPYIKRQVTKNDAERYQTVYARKPGAIASPTAGLHFTEDVLRDFAKRNIGTIYLTLDVGLGTFTPVRTENIAEHAMHEENFEVTETAAAAISDILKAGCKVCAVGTTSCRVLETCARKDNGDIVISAGQGKTDLFIYPPFTFKATSMLLTNFHLPKTTLLMLVCAFAGRELVLDAYRQAVEMKYRFFSYGDAMLII